MDEEIVPRVQHTLEKALRSLEKGLVIVRPPNMAWEHECGRFSVVCYGRVHSISLDTAQELIIIHKMASREARRFGLESIGNGFKDFVSGIRKAARKGLLVRVAYRSGLNTEQSLFRVICTG